MLSIDLNSTIPLQEQIRGGFHQLLLKGQLKPGDVLPIEEDLAAILLINQSIIGCAYEELLKEKVVEKSENGRFVVLVSAQASVSGNLANVVQELIESIAAARKAGLSQEQIDSVLEMLKQANTIGPDGMIPSIF